MRRFGFHWTLCATTSLVVGLSGCGDQAASPTAETPQDTPVVESGTDLEPPEKEAAETQDTSSPSEEPTPTTEEETPVKPDESESKPTEPPPLPPAPEPSSETTSESGSDSQAKATESMKESDSPAETVAESEPEEQPKEPLNDGYVDLPESYKGRMGRFYTMVREDLAEGETSSKPVLMQVSFTIAREVVESDAKLSRALFKQAGEIIETMGTPDKYKPALAMISYNEACALALEEKLDEAGQQLTRSVELGYDDFKAIRADEDLKSLLTASTWQEQLGKWEAEKLERLRAMAKQELADGETYPFDLFLPTYDGQEIALSDYQGKVVIVDIWGTWCPPCRAEIPSFIKLQNERGEQGFQMIGINYERSDAEEDDVREQENREKVASFVEKNGINYPCVMGDPETKSQVPNFRGFPTTLFIDRNGKVRMTAVGLHEYEYLDTIVSLLLEEEFDPAAVVATKKPAPKKETAESNEKPEQAPKETDASESDSPKADTPEKSTAEDGKTEGDAAATTSPEKTAAEKAPSEKTTAE